MRRALRVLLTGPVLAIALLLALLPPAAQAGDDGLPLGFDPQWNLKVIQAPKAWAITRGSPNVVVGVIDTGIDSSHPEFAGRIVAGKNFNGAGDTSDAIGHGTFVSGIIAGASVGVAPNVRIMPLKVFDEKGNTSSHAVAEAINYGLSQGVRIFNLSLGSSRESDEVADAVANAHSKGAILIAAAGNSGRSATGNTTAYPAACKGAFAVAATTSDDKPAFYSSPGSYVKVSAPAGDYNDSMARDPLHSIYGAHPGGKLAQYDQFVGTSFAAPHVAGLAALIWSVNPDLSNSQVEQIIMRTADRLWAGNAERTDQLGFGRINAYRAVVAATPHDWRVDLTTPRNGDAAAGTITFAGWAADMRSQAGPLVESVQLFVDGPMGDGTQLGEARFPLPTADLLANSGSAPISSLPPMDGCAFTFTWDTTGLQPGPRQVYVGAKTLTGDWIWTQVSVRIDG